MAYRIVLRQDLATNWTTNDPVLLSGELGFETNTSRLKLGDGVKRWSQLPYYLRAPYYGHFYDTTLQSVGSTGSAYYVRCNTTDLSSGVYVTGSTAAPTGATGNFRFYVENDGVYNVSLTGNLRTCATGGASAYVWLSKNGADVPYSGQFLEIPSGTSSPAYDKFSYDYPVSATGGSYFEIKYGNDACSLLGFQPVTGPTGSPYESVPSVSVTISQIG